jgi:RNA polymerase sigma-70 factor (ECF subfamily)
VTDGLLPDIAAGDGQAFGRWMAGAEPRIRASLASFAASVDTEAVVQECLLRVWQVAPRVKADGQGDSLLRLAVRIARNLAVDETRRMRGEIPSAEPDAHAAAGADRSAEVLVDPLLRRVIEACRRRLPRKPALALDARVRAGGVQPDEQSAARLGMTVNTFLQNFTRARRLLARCLRERGVDLEALLS